MAILSRDVKVNNSKLQYLNKIELPELLEIIEKNNINIKSDKKEDILKEIKDDLSKIVIIDSNQIQSDSESSSDSINESASESSNYISSESESDDSKLFELSSSESSLSLNSPVNIRQIIRFNH
jgi:molybdenum cofactor biosynthesis enzyme MoaA